MISTIKYNDKFFGYNAYSHNKLDKKILQTNIFGFSHKIHAEQVINMIKYDHYSINKIKDNIYILSISNTNKTKNIVKNNLKIQDYENYLELAYFTKINNTELSIINNLRKINRYKTELYVCADIQSEFELSLLQEHYKRLVENKRINYKKDFNEIKEYLDNKDDVDLT